MDPLSGITADTISTSASLFAAGPDPGRALEEVTAGASTRFRIADLFTNPVLWLAALTPGIRSLAIRHRRNQC
jgi:hypothetical protein